jgi:tetratricopeptide (TPR) repeat protein
MINLPPKLTPSQLLSRDELSPLIDELLHDCRSLRMEGRLPEAERRALDAVEASRESGAQVGHGVALVHLGDVHREMGKLGPALADCQKAQRIFQRQASPYQRHNEAVAAYALGLVHQLLGNDMDALKWYQQSGEHFARVKDDWVAVNALEQVEIGASAQRWMNTLSKYLTEERARADANLVTGIRVPIILLDADGGGFAIADLEIDQYAVDRQLRIDGKAFRVQSLKGRQRAVLSPGVEYYAREIPDAACGFLGAGEGDYALVVQMNSADKEGPGVLETLGGPEFGKFERDAEGQIVFARPGAAPIVIGSEDIGEDLRVGYITALLKPV